RPPRRRFGGGVALRRAAPRAGAGDGAVGGVRARPSPAGGGAGGRGGGGAGGIRKGEGGAFLAGGGAAAPHSRAGDDGDGGFSLDVPRCQVAAGVGVRGEAGGAGSEASPLDEEGGEGARRRDLADRHRAGGGDGAPARGDERGAQGAEGG